MRSTSATKTYSAIGPSRARSMRGSGWRIGDHRREFRLGRELPVDEGAAGELTDGRALLDKLHFEPQEHARFDRLAELRPIDRHEIDELARTGEAESFDGKHARRLGERLDDQHSRHDG